MARYLIEIPHKAEKLECMQAKTILLTTGSHFLTNADWGCLDGEHKAWFFMEAENKEEVVRIIPPAYRDHSKIVKLSKYNLNDPDGLVDVH